MASKKDAALNNDELQDLQDDELDADAPAARPAKAVVKMRVENIKPFNDGSAMINLRPVTSGSPDNDAFFHLMPSGAVALGPISEAAARLFVLNADYMVEFTPA